MDVGAKIGAAAMEGGKEVGSAAELTAGREGEKSMERPTIESHSDGHFNKDGDWTLLGPHC